MKPLVIILITYARNEDRANYTMRTIDGIIDNLQCSGGLSWYVCDDKSPGKHYKNVLTKLRERDQHICGHHTERLGYGAGVNKAWQIASQTSPVTLWLEDDWELRTPLNIDKYIDILNGRHGVGMVRLGHIPKGQSGDVVGYEKTLFLKIDRSKSYAFSGNPHLKHDSHMLIYGKYPEGLNPGNTETTYDSVVRSIKGPDIVWPLSIGDGYIFHHIGRAHSYDH